MPVVKNRCNRDVLPHTFNIGVFKSIKKNPDTLQHIYNESANIIEGCNVAFDTNACGISHKWCQWLALRVWWHVLIFITHEITLLIKPAAKVKLMPFPAKIHTVML